MQGEPPGSPSIPGAQAGPGARQGHVPDFFIVGHEKCGTTALFKMLRNHPQIFMPDHKEPRFFSWDLRDSPPQAGAVVPHDLESYLALFAPAEAGQLVGEASPQYIRSPGAAAQIARLRPDARIIAIFREPAAFLRSFHIQAVRSRVETERDLRTALALEDARREGREIPHGTHVSWLMYAEHVRYVEQLRRFEDAFGAENVLALIYDDYRRDNEQTLARVMRFLGVEQIALAPIETNNEKLTGVRFMALHRISRRLRMARHRPDRADPLTRTVAKLVPRSLQGTWRRMVYEVPPPLDPELAGELHRRFRGEVVALGEHLDRDLVSLWRYDER